MGDFGRKRICPWLVLEEEDEGRMLVENFIFLKLYIVLSSPLIIKIIFV